MGKPRLVILIRHGQSDGNKNKAVHQTTPDHRVRLTSKGHSQALEAGDRLASMLLPTDTLQIITSPYTRTRETTQGILSSSLQHHPAASSIKVYEEPRIREQDFGNFQPCSAEMTRMWEERAAYGHFFYRIPNGESAADAYDRVSGFNESLWRQFGDPEFPSVLVLVTHGLWVWLNQDYSYSNLFDEGKHPKRWYHYSVEYFEDLRNVNHCEFVIMERDPQEEASKYTLTTQLRTWTGYAAQREEDRYTCPPRPLSSLFPPTPPDFGAVTQGDPPVPRFGGCVDGCNHPRPKRHHMRIESLDTALNSGVLTAGEEAQRGRDFGGSRSGAGSAAGSSDEEEVDVEEEEEVPSGEVSEVTERWDKKDVDARKAREERLGDSERPSVKAGVKGSRGMEA